MTTKLPGDFEATRRAGIQLQVLVHAQQIADEIEDCRSGSGAAGRDFNFTVPDDDTARIAIESVARALDFRNIYFRRVHRVAEPERAPRLHVDMDGGLVTVRATVVPVNPVLQRAVFIILSRTVAPPRPAPAPFPFAALSLQPLDSGRQDSGVPHLPRHYSLSGLLPGERGA